MGLTIEGTIQEGVPCEAKVADELERGQRKRQGTTFHDLPSVWKLNANVEWLVDEIIPLNAITLLSAHSGTGKTWLAHAIGGAVAHGHPFLGRRVLQRPVVYLDRENPLAIVKRNLECLGVAETENYFMWGGWNVPGPALDDPELVEFVKQYHPLIVVDSLVRFHTGDEQSAKETSAFMKLLRELCHLGGTVIILHHTGKGKNTKQYRGSSDIEAAVDMAYTLEGRPRNGLLHRLRMENFKSRFAAGMHFGLEFENGRGFRSDEVQNRANPVMAEEVVDGIIAEHPGLNGTDIVAMAQTQGVGKKMVRDILKTRVGVKGQKRSMHHYPPPATTELVA